MSTHATRTTDRHDRTRPRRGGRPARRSALAALSLATVLAVLGPITSASAASGNLDTFAGNGTGATTGNGGPATAAGVLAPIDMTWDADGNAYIAARNEGDVRKVATDGTISTLASGYQAPSAIVYDKVSNALFLASENDRSVFKITLAGVSTRFAGTGTEGYNGDGIAADTAQLNFPRGVAVDGAGNVFISDTDNDRIREVTTDNVIHTVAGSGVEGNSGDGAAATAATLHHPWALDVAADGTVVVADAQNCRVRSFQVGGSIQAFAGTGTCTSSGDGGPALAAGFSAIVGLAIDPSGIVFVGEFGHRTRAVSVGGTVVTVAGTGTNGYNGDGIPSTTAELNFPKGIALDAAGALYIADYGNNRVRVLPDAASLVPGGGVTPTTVTTPSTTPSTTAPTAPVAAAVTATPGLTG